LDCQSLNLVFDDASTGKYFKKKLYKLHKSIFLWPVSGFVYLASTCNFYYLLALKRVSFVFANFSCHMPFIASFN
jgi:hypothetical protein